MPDRGTKRKAPDANGSIPDAPSDADILKIRKILLRWGRAHYREFPWRHPAQLWHGLIAEILLQRTKAGSVVDVYNRFLERFPAIADLAQASIADIEQVIYPLGLRWRAPLLKKLGECLVELRGALPNTLQGLLELPGIGPYAASAWLGFHGGKRGVIVDANVVRWLCRMVDQSMDGETRRKRWLIELANRFTPERDWKAYNYALLDFSMEICSIKPRCAECPIGPRFCKYRRKNLTVLEIQNATGIRSG